MLVVAWLLLSLYTTCNTFAKLLTFVTGAVQGFDPSDPDCLLLGAGPCLIHEAYHQDFKVMHNKLFKIL